jgi:hypothetical protein
MLDLMNDMLDMVEQLEVDFNELKEKLGVD